MLIGWLAGWQFSWLVGRLVGWFVSCLVGWLVSWLTGFFTRSACTALYSLFNRFALLCLPASSLSRTRVTAIKGLQLVGRLNYAKLLAWLDIFACADACSLCSDLRFFAGSDSLTSL